MIGTVCSIQGLRALKSIYVTTERDFRYYFLSRSSFLSSLCFDCCCCRMSTYLHWTLHKWCSSLSCYRLIYYNLVLYMSSSIFPFQHTFPCICQHWFWTVKVLLGCLALLAPLAPLWLSRIICIICWFAMALQLLHNAFYLENNRRRPTVKHQSFLNTNLYHVFFLLCACLTFQILLMMTLWHKSNLQRQWQSLISFVLKANLC